MICPPKIWMKGYWMETISHFLFFAIRTTFSSISLISANTRIQPDPAQIAHAPHPTLGISRRPFLEGARARRRRSGGPRCALALYHSISGVLIPPCSRENRLSFRILTAATKKVAYRYEKIRCRQKYFFGTLHFIFCSSPPIFKEIGPLQFA